MLAQGQLDLAVVFDGSSEAGLLLKPVVAESLLLVGRAGTLKQQQSVSAQEAASYPLLMLSRPNGIREAAEGYFAAAKVTPRVTAEINAPHLLLQAVEAGIGLSILPSCGIDQAVREGRLQAVALDKGA